MSQRRTALLVLLLVPGAAACQPLAPGGTAQPGRPPIEGQPEAGAALTSTLAAGAPSRGGRDTTAVAARPLTPTLAITAATSSDLTAGSTGSLGATGSTTATATGAMTGTTSMEPMDVLTPTTGTALPADTDLAAMSAAMPPANPLSPLEQERAAALALDAPGTEEVVANAIDRDAVNSNSAAEVSSLSGRPSYRILFNQRAPDKFAVGRAAEVGIYRYDTDDSLVNRVDLISGQVSAQPIPPGQILPLAVDEITEAATVARNDPRVAEALHAAGQDPASAKANALLTQGTEPSSPCAAHRCLRLFFSTEERPAPTFSAIVDLSALTVVEVISFDAQTGSPDQ
jgi:hypothetical protein